MFQQWYAYGNYIDEVLMMGTTASPTSARFYIHDHLYSPAALTNWLGTILERYEYDAYGSPTIWNTDFTTERDSSNYGNPYLFTGRRVDILDSGSLKIQYNRNRYYDYYTGRWFTHDPLGITPNYRKPNEFRPFGQYEDSLNLYEMMGSNPLIGTDPRGLSMWPISIIQSLLGRFATCDFAREFFKVLKQGNKQLPGLISARDNVIFGGGFPYGHCVWSCQMVKDKNEQFARDMGKKKEELDNAMADWAETIPDCVWYRKDFRWFRENIGLWVCSAGQTSDDRDNEAGIDCGLKSPLPCWQCCVVEKKIPRDTPEGDSERPFGKRCRGRYLLEAKKKFGPVVEVEEENEERFSIN